MKVSEKSRSDEKMILTPYYEVAEEILNFGDGFLKCEISDDTGQKFLAVLKAGKVDAICEDEFFDTHNFTVKFRVTAFVDGMSAYNPEFTLKVSDLKKGIALVRSSLPYITSRTDFKKFLQAGVLLQVESVGKGSNLFLLTL